MGMGAGLVTVSGHRDSQHQPGENIAAGRGTAEGSLDQWKESDGHCRNMMNSRYTRVGIGYGFNEASRFDHYWTELVAQTDADLDTTCYPARAFVSGSIQPLSAPKLFFVIGFLSLFTV